MCGPTGSLQVQPQDAKGMLSLGFPVLELPKRVAVNSLSIQRSSHGAAAAEPGSPPDSRSSTPRSHGHGLRGVDDCSRSSAIAPLARQQALIQQQQEDASPLVSPRSACSTPGGADNSMGIQLHALVFNKQRHQPTHRRSMDTHGSSSSSSRQQQQQLLAAGAPRHHSLPHRNQTSHDLRRHPHDSSNSWGSRGGGSMLQSISALGLTSSHAGTASHRGSISKAKQVLAEAVNSMPGTHGLSDYSPASCDAGVLAPLLSIIRQDGGASRSGSFSEATSACSSTSSGCGFMMGSAAGVVGAAASRLVRCSSGPRDDACFSIPPTLHEEGAIPVDARSHAELLAAKQARQSAAHVQKVVDCIDTVKYLSMDDSNRMALIDLGAIELLLSKLQPSAQPAAEVSVAALGALSAICKYDALKQQLWENPDSSVILQLLRSRRISPEAKAAHMATGLLAWSCDSSSGSICASALCGASSSVFDSVSSAPCCSADSSSSSSVCSGANVLLEPALIPALAEALHPAADAAVLLSALRLLSKAAGSTDPELPIPPRSPSPAGSPTNEQQQQRPQCVAAGWHKVLFALMPLLIPTHRRQGHVVLSAALELLVVLTEQHAQLHAAVSIAGCLPPLLAQVLQGSSEQSLQAACILTGIVDTPAAQERLCQEPALAALLRVLQDRTKSVDVRLAAVHMLRRLAAAVPRCVVVLKAQAAVPAVVALLREVRDSDVRHAAAGLLHLLGTPVVVRSRRSSDKGRSAQQCGAQQQQQQQQHGSGSGNVLEFEAHVAPRQQRCYQQRQHAPMVAAGAAVGARALY